MSSLVSPAIAGSQPLAMQTISQAALMECLCQLQDQALYAQMAQAIMASDLQRAQRAYQRLALRAPKPTTDSPDATDAPDQLGKLFTSLGLALDTKDTQHAQSLWQSLQAAVTEARAHHQHSRSGSSTQAVAKDQTNDPPQLPGHIDIKV